MSNCLDCASPSGLWGNHTVPANPDGWYRHLWQLQDHFGCKRLFPSYAMQCAGITQRGDHWWPLEWKNLVTKVNNGNPWWTKQGLFLDALKTPNQVITDVAAAVGYPDNIDLLVWWVVYSPARSSKRDLYFWSGAWNGFRGWRMSDKMTWVYPGASPGGEISYPPVFAVTRPLAFGDIFTPPL